MSSIKFPWNELAPLEGLMLTELQRACRRVVLGDSFGLAVQDFDSFVESSDDHVEEACRYGWRPARDERRVTQPEGPAI